MATTLQLYKNSVLALDLNTSSGGNPYLLETLELGEPARDRATGLTDTLADVEGSAEIRIEASTIALLVQYINALETLLLKCGDRAYLIELAYAPDGHASYKLYTELCAAWLTRPEGVIEKNHAGNYTQAVTLHFWRRPEFESALDESNTFDDATSNVTLGAALKGELPAHARLEFAPANGNVADCQVVLAAVYARESAGTFYQKLHAGDYSQRDATMSDLTAATDATFESNGSGMAGQIFTPASVNEVVALRWEFSANALANFTDDLFCVRYRDRHTSPNFYLAARTGLKIGSTRVYGVKTPYVLTRTNDASRTTECGYLGIGLVRTPGLGTPDAAVATYFFELLVKAKTVAGTLEINYCERFPLGEAANGKGLVMAEFGAPFSGVNVILDSRPRFDRAYLTNGSDVKLLAAADVPAGSEILLPPNCADTRVFFKLLTGASDGYRHDKDTTADVVVGFRERWLRYKTA